MASYESRPREFLYVDTQRVKSFLAHMEGGLVEQTKAGHTDNVKAGAQAKLLGVRRGRRLLARLETRRAEVSPGRSFLPVRGLCGRKPSHH